MRSGPALCSEVTSESGVSAIAGSWVGIWSWATLEHRGRGEAGAGLGAGTVSMGMSVAIGSFKGCR